MHCPSVQSLYSDKRTRESGLTTQVMESHAQMVAP